MNRHQAVVLSNRLCIEVAQKAVDRRRWPVGGWGGLPAGAAGDAELRRRVEALLSSPHVGEEGRRALLAFYEAPPVETGPAEEKWAFAPGVTPVDVAAAEEWIRAEHSSSPFHLVAERRMEKRLEGEAEKARLEAEIAADEEKLDALSDDALDEAPEAASGNRLPPR